MHTHILDCIDHFLREDNRLCATYCMLCNVQNRVVAEANEVGQEIPVVNSFSKKRQTF